MRWILMIERRCSWLRFLNFSIVKWRSVTFPWHLSIEEDHVVGQGRPSSVRDAREKLNATSLRSQRTAHKNGSLALVFGKCIHHPVSIISWIPATLVDLLGSCIHQSFIQGRMVVTPVTVSPFACQAYYSRQMVVAMDFRPKLQRLFYYWAHKLNHNAAAQRSVTRFHCLLFFLQGKPLLRSTYCSWSVAQDGETSVQLAR